MASASRSVGSVSVTHHPIDSQVAEWIAAAYADSLALVEQRWGLGPPDRCRLYVMTSWIGFIFRSAPWPWRLLLGTSFPLWAPRARRTWRISAAWTQRYGNTVAVGIKPPRLLQPGRSSVGSRILTEGREPRRDLRHVTCHELVHACSAHLRLPMLLNEGIAMVTVDEMLGEQTVRSDTLEMLGHSAPGGPPPTYRELSRMPDEEMAYHIVRGYWLVRFIETTYLGAARTAFAEAGGGERVEARLIETMGMQPSSFWSEIDAVVARHFRDGCR